jgi:HlyD family secretion protein
VQNLKVHTPGAVIRAGEPLLDIVPADDDLIVQAHVSPLDVNSITEGAHSEVRFPSFKSRTLPTIFGSVTSISKDRLMDDATKQPYFLALIKVDTAHIPEEFRTKLTPGLNAEIILPTGERTVMAYLIDPLRDTMRKTFREK